MQIRVREKFALLQEMDVEQGTVPWTLIDASQSIEEVASDVWETVQQSIRSSSDQPIKLMWLEGNFDQ
jgi:thymidylate kinase